MIQITDQTKCCGCTACAAVCPHGCITMSADEEGFLYPTVRAETCIGCGACEAVCPYQSGAQPAAAGGAQPQAAAMYAGDQALRLFSSSGGIFSLLASDVLAAGGAVAGAVYDESFQVRHVLAWDEAHVEPMRGAKYVQSDLGDLFCQIRELLDGGVPVLFSGTPCQTNGLRAFLGQSPDHLLTVAIVCHGVPAPAVWRRHLESLGHVTDVRLRDKRDSWKRYATNYYAGGREIFRPVMDDPYMKGFLRDLYTRPACAACPVKGGVYADITLGDFWGIEKFHPEMDDDKGTSLVLTATARGRAAIEQLRGRVQAKDVSFAQGTQYNPAVVQPAAPHPMRAAAMRRILAGEPVARVVQDYTKPTGKERVLSLARRLLRR